MSDRLPVSFHKTFPLNRAAIAQVLRLSSEVDGTGARLTPSFVHERTTLGTQHAVAMPNYAVGAGLLDDRLRFTALGRVVYEHDPFLSSNVALWLLHYGLSAVSGPGPKYWHELVIRHFSRLDAVLVSAEIRNEVAALAQEAGGKPISERTAKATSSAFLSSYANTEGLGGLGVLREEGSGKYRVNESPEIGVTVFAYALADHWSANWSDTTGIHIARIHDEIGPLLLIGSTRINALLSQMQTDGLIEVQLRQPPYQANKLWRDKAALTERLYG